jgi:error-prone DNA polymerase
VFEKYRRAARGAAAIIAQGKVERQGEVVHLLVERIEDVAEGLASFASRSRDFR